MKDFRYGGRADLEVTILNSAGDLISWAHLAPRDGFEPPAKRLTAACSTAELPGTSLLARLLYSNESVRIQ